MAAPVTLLDRIALDARSIFGLEADGGIEATITPNGGSAGPVRGTFRNGSEDLDPGGTAVIDGGPVFVCKASDVSTVIRGNSCVINSTTYYVTKKESTGYGTAVLFLSEDDV
jgi:hypothetical protein